MGKALEEHDGLKAHEPEARVQGVEAAGRRNAQLQVGVEVGLEELEEDALQRRGRTIQGVVQGVGVPPQAKGLPHHLEQLAGLPSKLRDVEGVQLVSHGGPRRGP